MIFRQVLCCHSWVRYRSLHPSSGPWRRHKVNIQEPVWKIRETRSQRIRLLTPNTVPWRSRQPSLSFITYTSLQSRLITTQNSGVSYHQSSNLGGPNFGVDTTYWNPSDEWKRRGDKKGHCLPLLPKWMEFLNNSPKLFYLYYLFTLL